MLNIIISMVYSRLFNRIYKLREPLKNPVHLAAARQVTVRSLQDLALQDPILGGPWDIMFYASEALIPSCVCRAFWREQLGVIYCYIVHVSTNVSTC
jgi:hypothetical protein